MKNKIFTIVCMFLLIISVFTSSVFASSYNASNGKSYDLPEFTDEMKKYDKYLIFVENDGKHFALYFLVDDDGYFFNNSSGIYCYGRLLICSTDGDGFYGSRYEVKSGTVGKIGGSITGSSTFISNVDIYTDVNKSDIFFSKTTTGDNGNSSGGNGESTDNETDKDNDSWLSKIFNSIGNISNSILQGLEVPFNAIKEKLIDIGNFFGTIINYLNPLSEEFFLKDFFNFIGNALSYINPFDENFIFKEFFSNFFSWFNPFSDNFILKKLWTFLVNIISYINPFDENFLGKKIVELIGNLLNTLFVPTNNPFNDLNNKFNEKFAFIEQIKTFVNSFLGNSNYGDKTPAFEMTWHGATFALIDFSLFLQYRAWLHGIILAIAWVIFIFRTYKKLPAIIGGFSQ